MEALQLVEVSKRAVWARVFIVVGALLAGASPFLSWSNGWLDGHSAVWRSVLNDSYALGYEGMLWVVFLISSALIAIVLALWRIPGRGNRVLSNRLGLLVICGFWSLLLRLTAADDACFGIDACDGVAPRLLLAAIPFVVLGALLLPPGPQGRGGRMGAIVVGIVLAAAVGAGIAVGFTPQDRCRGCDDHVAQSSLRNALAAAETFAKKHHDSYSGFGPSQAVKIEPSLAWFGAEHSSAGPDEVVIREADGSGLLLVARSTKGDYLCVAKGSEASPSPPPPVDTGKLSFGYASQDILNRSGCIGVSWPSHPSA